MSVVTLVPWREEYGELFFLRSNDPELYANMSDDFPKTEAECRAVAAAFAAGGEERQCARVILVDGEVAGCAAAFLDSGLYRRSAELAYWLGREYRGRGVMTEALEEFREIMFERYDLRRLYARPFAHNLPYRRCLEKAGFRLEGILRCCASKGTAVFDAALYAAVREGS